MSRDIGWSIGPITDRDIGEQFIVDATHKDGFWAKFLVTIIEKVDDDLYDISLDTVLDGSPGILEGYLGREINE